MIRKEDIPATIYEDEIIRFLADRYHTSPALVIDCFLVQDGNTQDIREQSFRLEENEMEILKEMIARSYISETI